MRSDAKTMTRRELLHNARVFGIAGAASIAVIVVATVVHSAGYLPEAGALVLYFFSAMFALGGLLGGSYFALRGLLRSADWRPSAADYPLRGFSAEREASWLREQVGKELQKRPHGAVRVTHVALDELPPDDPRSEWRQFIESSRLVGVQHRFDAEVEVGSRPVKVSVHVGRGPDDPRALRSRVVLSAPCEIPLGRELRWRGRFEGDPLADKLNADARLSELLTGLIRARGLTAGGQVFHPDPNLAVLPSGPKALVTADTVMQEWKGGFVLTLGLSGFLDAIDRIEAGAVGRRSAS